MEYNPETGQITGEVEKLPKNWAGSVIENIIWGPYQEERLRDKGL